MSHFPDTSFLCALYRTQVNSADADRYMERLSGALRVSSLLLLEYRQSVRLQVRLHSNDHSKGFPLREGEQMLKDLRSDLATGTLRTERVEWADVHHEAERLSEKYTVSAGHRLADILHVATAIHLGAHEFLTFDVNQKRLAKAEGLHVPL